MFGSSTNDDVRDRVRYWIGDSEGGEYGHFEGSVVWLDPGQVVSGTWVQQVTWSGSYDVEETSNAGGSTFRQIIPYNLLSNTGDGVRVTLSGSPDHAITINNVSYMSGSSDSVTLDFQTNSTILKEDLKGSIERWKNDGYTSDGAEDLQGVDAAEVSSNYIDIQRSQQYGHFEGYEVDFDDGEDAILYSPNVIGFRCQNHGLEAGDYIRVYGTQYYDGYYIILTYSTAHIIVVWGIYDPETFTSSAKIRKIISLGPEIDLYGEKQDCRDILPSMEINFYDGETAYISEYSNYGLEHGSVRISSVQPTSVITSIYDVGIDSEGWLTSMPGPDNNQEWETNMPSMYSGYFKARLLYDYNQSWYDPSHGYSSSASEPYSYTGKGWIITEAEDPEFEGDWTGQWDPVKLFDTNVSQPWFTMVADGCPWLTLCYRGPNPVKFHLDMQSPKSFNKYRLWMQLWLCGRISICPPPTISYPKSWVLEGSNVKADDGDWITLHTVTDYDPESFVPSQYPIDKGIPLSCGESEWFTFRNPYLFRYYRLHIYEVWSKSFTYANFTCAINGLETTHIDEWDLCERRAAPGLFPTVVSTNLFFDKITQVDPQEQMLKDSTAFYCLSFDDGVTFNIYYESDWKTIVQNNNGTWQYLYNDLFYDAEDNNVRRALWQAFSDTSNRATAESIVLIPEQAYQDIAPSGTYLQIGVGLASAGYIESMLEGITIRGTVYDPVGSTEPIEMTFSGGQSGCVIPAGEHVVSDWVNADVLPNYDLLFVVDTATTVSGTNRWVTEEAKYFEKRSTASYYLQDVNTLAYTLQDGIVYISAVETRQSDTVTLPATGNSLITGSIITISGMTNYDGRHVVSSADPTVFSIPHKHYTETVPSGALARERFSTLSQPHTQVGSLIEFGDTGEYWQSNTTEVTASGLYEITENCCVIGKEATHLFDSNDDVGFHSGRAIEDGSVHIGITLFEEPRAFNTFRLKSSSNDWYWDREFPKGYRVSASNLTSPDLENDGDWTLLTSGTYTMPVGPQLFGEWESFSCASQYNHFRISFDSNYGDWYDCVRLAQIEVGDTNLLTGYTFIENKPGYDSRYLLDSSAYSQYVSDASMASGPYHIAIDYRNRPKRINAYRIKSIRDSVTDSADDPWERVSPKDIVFSASNLSSPVIDNDSHWVELSSDSLAQPQVGSTYSDWVSVSGYEDIYRHYRLKITSTWGGTGSYIEFSDLDLTSIVTTEYNAYVQYDDTGYPIKLFDLPVNNVITGIYITTVTGIASGWTTQSGNENTGTYDTSFVTLVDRHWSLDSSKAIAQVGIYSDLASEIDIKIFKERTPGATEWFDISEVETVSHPGGGFQWFTLSNPYSVPADGTYYIGWYQPNYPRKMGETGGTGAVSYQFGEYTGTNINLPLHNDMRPCIAVRYAGYYTLGTLDDSDYFLSTFSPSRTGDTFVSSQTYGSFYDGVKPVYLYRPPSFSSPDTAGQIKISFSYKEEQESTYDAPLFTIRDSGHKSYNSRVALLGDGDTGTYYSPEKELDEVIHLKFMVRFSNETYMNAYSICTASGSKWDDYFPDSVEIGASSVYLDLDNSDDWTRLYYDEGFLKPTAEGTWRPLLYFDDHTINYKYFKFDFWHYGYPNSRYGKMSGAKFAIDQTTDSLVTVTGTMNVVKAITNTGLEDSEVQLLEAAGETRSVSHVWNTYSHNAVNEASPGSYFHDGENSNTEFCPHPESIVNSDVSNVIISPYEFGGMNILAWHKLEEATGNFLDYSGNNVIASRVGTIQQATGKRGYAAGLSDDDSLPKYAIFTLPHRLTAYTVSFWFKPVHDLYPGYSETFDIMGGWTSYGNIPGVWNISYGRHYIYEDTPYPFKQVNKDPMPYYESRIFFGNYGRSVCTGRKVWSHNTWHHIVFSFDGNGNYKVWEDGALDAEATYQSSNIYPPATEIVVDPSDIHYDLYGYKNCMYFGLPWLDSQGVEGEFWLDHVMHFGKVLSDEEVFQIYRLKDESDNWDGIYFPSAETITVPGNLMFDFGEDTSINKYSLLTSSGTASPVQWRLLASGTNGWDVLHTTDSNIVDEQIYNFINTKEYRYYSLEFINASLTSIELDGLRAYSSEMIPTVTGAYLTVTSGINASSKNIAYIDNTSYIGGAATMSFAVSRDDTNWYIMTSGWEAVSLIREDLYQNQMSSGTLLNISQCEWDTLGSGNLSIAHVFITEQETIYPAIYSYDPVITDWTTSGVATPITVGGSSSYTIPSGNSVWTDWLHYSNDDYTFSLFSADITSGNIAQSDVGRGYLIDSVLTCSGTVMVSGVQIRYNDITIIPVSSSALVYSGGRIHIENMSPYTTHSVVGVDSSNITIDAPFFEISVPSGATYRRLIDLPSEYVDTYVLINTETEIVDIDDYTITLAEDQATGTVSGIYASSSGIPITSTGVALYSTVDNFSFTYLGRLSSIDVSSSEPSGTAVYHALSFDNKETYSIYQSNSWLQVIKNEGGQWKYYDDSWKNATANTSYGALRDLVSVGYPLLTSDSFSNITESDWHKTGAITSSSGSIDALFYLLNNGVDVPTVSSYEINYVVRDSGATDQVWATSLIPSGYALDRHYVDGASPYYEIPTELDTYSEGLYDRISVDMLRLYFVSSSGVSVSLSEVALLDCQPDDDDYYLNYTPSALHGSTEYTDGELYTGYLIAGYRLTGGISIDEQDSTSITISGIARNAGLYYGELRFYFESALGIPTISGVSTESYEEGCPSYLTDPTLYSNYISYHFWSQGPVKEISLSLSNSNPTGSGVVRLNEISAMVTTASGWDVDDEFNLLETADTTSISGTTVSGYTYQALSTPLLERLFDTTISGAIPIFPSWYIGVSSDLGSFGGRASEYRIYMETASGVDTYLFTQTSGIDVWTERTLTWSGSYFSYLFEEPTNVTATKVFCVNTNSGSTYEDLRWCRALQLINSPEEIDFGLTGSGTGELDLETYYSRPESVHIYNNNRSGTYANARILPRFTNNYDLDRTVQISEDSSVWYGLNSGLQLPEDLPFEMGEFSDTEMSSGAVKLVGTALSGTWVSPVIESLDPSSTVAYIYTKNTSYDGSYVNKDYSSVMNIVEVRSSNTRYIQSFLVTGVNTEPYGGLQLPWKLVAFDSNGDLLDWDDRSLVPVQYRKTLELGSLTEEDDSPSRGWVAGGRQPLWQFYGTLDARNYGGISLGNLWGGESLGVTQKDYKLFSTFPSDASIDSTDIDDENELHIYWNTHYYLEPIFNKSLRYTTRYQSTELKKAWQLVDVVYRPLPFYERYQEEFYSEDSFHLRSLFTFEGSAATPEHTTEIDYVCSLPGDSSGLLSDSIRCAACIDGQAGEYYTWVHYAYVVDDESYYRTFLLNGENIVGQWDDTIQYSFNYIVEASPVAPRGFWGIAETGVYWCEYSGGNISVKFSVTTDGTKTFKFLTYGYSDYNNNLWVVDLATERVIRINFEEQTADYSRVIDGVCSVYPEPFDGSAYVYVLRDLEFPENDCIKLVHASDYDYLVPEVVCAVPGVALIDPYNVNLYGRGHYPEDSREPLPGDSIWTDSGVAWQRYSSGSPTLPKGQYKQFRITLQRQDVDSVSPEIEYIRIPVPAVVNKIPWHDSKRIYVSTLLSSENTVLTAGEYTVDLLVWWPRE
jgi:hypothetical protein